VTDSVPNLFSLHDGGDPWLRGLRSPCLTEYSRGQIIIADIPLSSLCMIKCMQRYFFFDKDRRCFGDESCQTVIIIAGDYHWPDINWLGCTASASSESFRICHARYMIRSGTFQTHPLEAVADLLDCAGCTHVVTDNTIMHQSHCFFLEL